tara:strand:+ start:55 stop:633 length:579 start_codon:yes stop_codon:yes gene_type:complete
MKYLEISTYHDTQIVSTADLKTHLKITFDDEDSYIASLEKAAVRRIEEFLNNFLLSTQLIQYGETFADLNILFKGPGLTEEISVSYKRNGSWSPWGTQNNNIEYVPKINPPRIYLLESATTPTTDDVFQAWKAEYSVGYASANAIPKAIIQAIKITVADLYENRQSVIVGKVVSEIPRTAQYLINPYKIQRL